MGTLLGHTTLAVGPVVVVEVVVVTDRFSFAATVTVTDEIEVTSTVEVTVEVTVEGMVRVASVVTTVASVGETVEVAM